MLKFNPAKHTNPESRMIGLSNEYLEALEADAKQNGKRIDDYDHVSEPLVMCSAAGWYIGQICFTYQEGEWVFSPYDRHTHYMTYSDAERQWAWEYDDSSADELAALRAGSEELPF